MSNKVEQVRELEGEEIIQWLKSPGVRTYRYEGNLPGYYFLATVGCVALIASAYLVYRSGLALTIHKAGFSILFVFSLWCFWIIGKWGLFSLKSYIGVSDEELMIGRGKRAVAIPLSRLTKETVDIAGIRQTKYTSVLPIRLEEYQADVHLVGPFANLKNLQVFIGDVLAQLLHGDGDEVQVGAG